MKSNGGEVFAIIPEFVMGKLIPDFQRIGIFLRHVSRGRKIDQTQVRPDVLCADIGRKPEAVRKDFFVHNLSVAHDDDEVRNIDRAGVRGWAACQGHVQAETRPNSLVIMGTVRPPFAVSSERRDLGMADEATDISALAIIDEQVCSRSRNIESRTGGSKKAGVGFVTTGQTRKRHKGESRSKQGRGKAPEGWHQLKKLPQSGPDVATRGNPVDTGPTYRTPPAWGTPCQNR